MIAIHSIKERVIRHTTLHVLLYLAALVGLCLTIVLSLVETSEMYRARSASVELLSRLDERGSHREGPNWPSGSPFLQGETVTVASAALLERITNIIVHAGGTVVSSEIEQRGAGPKDGYITAIATCELEQDALQRVLYDIEAGMPFLFVTQLTATTSTAPTKDRLMHVQLTVDGLYLITK